MTEKRVSVIVPVRNEAAFISENIQSLLNQSYPSELFEILAVDGRSTDGTDKIIKKLAEEHPSVKYLENPKQIVTSAFNIGIQESKADYIMIVGGHTIVEGDYIEQAVQLMEDHPEVMGGGGPVVPIGQSLFGKAVALAMSHPVGIGNATHRYPNFEGYAFGSAFPIFRRELFDDIGLYDERFVRNQDDELLLRMQIKSLKNFISPKVKSKYFVRDTPSKLFKQYFQYGFWRIPVLLKHGQPASIRQILPLLFFACIILVAFASLSTRVPDYAGLIIPSFYFGVLFLTAAFQVRRYGLHMIWSFPIAVITMHTAYALGMFKALGQRLYGNKLFESDASVTEISR